MKVYIQCGNNGLRYNMNTFAAMLGFLQMGIETTLFTDKEDLINAEITDIVVGGVGRVKQFLENKGITVNDGYSLGSYGLDPLLYAKLLSARWAELTGTEDECAFDIK